MRSYEEVSITSVWEDFPILVKQFTRAVIISTRHNSFSPELLDQLIRVDTHIKEMIAHLQSH